jgi:hypothetical protein
MEHNKIPKGIWTALIHEMKKYKSFRDGYHSGQLVGLKSVYLSRESDSSYRHKFGVLLACYEAGDITDIFLDRRNYTITAYFNEGIVYKFQQ